MSANTGDQPARSSQRSSSAPGSRSSIRKGSGRKSDTVVFNVGGKHFEVLRQTIERYPSTLLACLVDDVGTDVTAPIFVDANPERFAHIIDWYRYGEMFLPPGPTIEAVMRDVRYFLLPDEITINGMVHTIDTSPKVCLVPSFEAVMKGIAHSWDGFGTYVERLAADANRAWETAVETSKLMSEHAHFNWMGDLGQLTPYTVELALSFWKWTDEKNVCNPYRLQLLVHELSRCGFACRVQANSDGRVLLHMTVRKVAGPAQAVRLEGLGMENGRLAVSSKVVCGQYSIGMAY